MEIISYQFWPTSRFHIDPFLSHWEEGKRGGKAENFGAFLCLAVDKGNIDVYGNCTKKLILGTGLDDNCVVWVGCGLRNWI